VTDSTPIASPASPAETSGIRRLTTAFRARYSTLPPGLQLVGLQLWLPLFFVCAFCFCYLIAFHHPQIHEAPVGVVASSGTIADLQDSAGEAVDLTRYSVSDGQKAVLDGKAIGLLDLSDPAKPELYIASAHQYQAATVAQSLFSAQFASAGTPLTVKDLAPLPAHDSFGMTTMYVMLALCIGGYMVAMFLGMMGGPLLHRTRFAVIAAGAIVVSFIVNLLAGPVIGAIDGHFFSLWAIGAAWIVAIGALVNGLSYFFGRFIVAPSILLVVFLSIPASGAAYPVWMIPPFFGAIQHGVIGFGMTEMIKRTLYGVGEPYWVGIVELLAYLVAGLLLSFLGKPWRERKDARRILAGRTTMFADAQNANREHHIQIRERILAKRGVVAASERLILDDAVGDPVVNGGSAISGDEAVTTSTIPIDTHPRK